MTSIVSTPTRDVQHEFAARDRRAEAAGVGYPFRDYLPVRIDVGKTLAKLSHPLLPNNGVGAIEIKDAALLSVLVETNGASVPVCDSETLLARVHSV
jgi:hypothetical protein